MQKIVLLSLLVLCSAELCPKFFCAPNGVVDPLDPQVCARRVNGIETVGNCPEGMFCNMDDRYNSTKFCIPKIEHKKLPGQKFEKSAAECFSGLVDLEKFCRGKPLGSECNNGDADCDVGLYCHPDWKVCTKAAQLNEPCGHDVKCASHLLCSWVREAEYSCLEYGRLPNGYPISIEDEPEICQSRYTDQHYTCQDGPKLTVPNVREMPGDECIYTKDNNSTAQCQFHVAGKAICARGIGDLENQWKIVRAYLKRAPLCHVMTPFAQCDMGKKVVQSKEEWVEIWHAISMLKWETQMEGLLPCLRQYVHPEAFKYTSFSAAMLAPFSALALLGFALIIL